jgi:hypothetical protein
MDTIEQIRNNLIDKILSIRNRDMIGALDKLLETTINEKNIYKTTEQQKLIFQASEIDIQNGDLFLDEEINQEEDLWLNK